MDVEAEVRTLIDLGANNNHRPGTTKRTMTFTDLEYNHSSSQQQQRRGILKPEHTPSTTFRLTIAWTLAGDTCLSFITPHTGVEGLSTKRQRTKQPAWARISLLVVARHLDR